MPVPTTREIRREFARRVMSLSDDQIEIFLDMDDLCEGVRTEIERRPDGLKQSLRGQLNSLLVALAQYPVENNPA